MFRQLGLLMILGGAATLGACAGEGSQRAAGVVTASVVEVKVPNSALVADPAIYHGDAWLREPEVPVHDLSWQLGRSSNSLFDGDVELPQSTCTPPLNVEAATQIETPKAVLSQAFFPRKVAETGLTQQLMATESHFFYSSTAAARAEFTAFAAGFASCVQAAGTGPEFDLLSRTRKPVVHHVATSVAGAAAGAWIHQVRFLDGAPVIDGNGGYAERSDSHYLAVQEGNVFDVLTIVGSAVIADSGDDETAIATMASRLANYGRPPTPANLPIDDAGQLWQAWPPPTALPAPLGSSWFLRPGGSVFGPTPLGNVACTPITEQSPVDPTIQRYDVRMYELSSPPNGHLEGQATLLRFTTPGAAVTAFKTLSADMGNCQATVRRQQELAELRPDATTTTLILENALGAWTLTATDFSDFSAQIQATGQTPTFGTHHITILVRGPFVEVIAVTGDQSSIAAIKTDADRAAADAAAESLCNFSGVCGPQ